MAVIVTHKVLIINGNSPKLPLPGAHSDEKRSLDKGCNSSKGLDLRYKPKPIAKTTRMLNQTKACMAYFPILSLNNLDFKLSNVENKCKIKMIRKKHKDT